MRVLVDMTEVALMGPGVIKVLLDAGLQVRAGGGQLTLIGAGVVTELLIALPDE